MKVLKQVHPVLLKLIDGSSCVTANKKSIEHVDPQQPCATAGAGVGAASGVFLQRHPRPQRGEHSASACGVPQLPSRGKTATGVIAGKKARFLDQISWSENETLRPSTTTAAHIGTFRGHRNDLCISDTGNIGVCEGVGVDVCVRVGGVGVGAAAKARLYRGYCAQRGGDYDREYRRHGGKETLERIALLNDAFR